ncbi:coiled-coil domain-containing protein 81-like [Parasteatoda tepidariorum]|uniref:coiled-coil domain-containing protein 81-like n=1 Tax=Parasteatoda tepidariorum TaxID=114398 RepID=UPI00077FBD29|nr:coiled-coil domain-containing protein 81-like [Parasteatoda tepidariorum]
MMVQELQTLVNNLKENPHTYIERLVTAEEVTSILHEVGKFIKENLQKNNTVVINGIGTFGLKQEKLLVSQQPVKYLISQIPVFVLSHSLALKFRIKWSRKYYEASFPERVFNSSYIAAKCKIQRSKVCLAMSELIAFMERSLFCQNALELPIVGVGTLRVHEDHYKMDFDESFLKDVSIQDVLYVVE